MKWECNRRYGNKKCIKNFVKTLKERPAGKSGFKRYVSVTVDFDKAC